MDALDVLCAQLTRDLFAIAKFLFETNYRLKNSRRPESAPSGNCYTFWA